MLDRWLALKVAQDRSPTTLALYSGIIEKHIKPVFGTTPVNRITALDLDDFYATLLRQKVGKVTVHKVHLILNGCFGQAVKWDLVATNPVQKATPPTLPTARTAEKTPSVDEVRRIYAQAQATDPDLAVLFRLAAATGARRGELVGLRWGDVDFDAKAVHIRRAVVRVDGGVEIKEPKSRKQRRVAIDDETLSILRTHRKVVAERSLKAGRALAEDAYLFSSRPGNTEPLRPETVTHGFKRIAKEIGSPTLTLHGLRHFHVSQLIAAGEDIVTVSKRVGHARPSITTDIYSHAQPERDRQAANRLAEIMGEAL